MEEIKIIRITTVAVSLKVLLKGQLRFIAENGFKVIGIASPDTVLEEVAIQEGISTIAIPMSRKITPIHDFLSLWRMYQLLRKERPQIVHTHTPKAGIIGMLGAKLAGVPIRLHTVAGLPLMEASGLKRKVLNLVERLTYACATKIYPNSKGLYDFIIKSNFAKSEKMKVIGTGSSNGIDVQFFSSDQVDLPQKSQLKKDLKIAEDDLVFIFVGRVVSDKGINELVTAFSNLKFKNKKLLLVGSTEPELDPLMPSTLMAMKNNTDILNIGFKKDVRPYFAIANCLVFPSYREGFPNVVMQAGAMGLPGIVSDINGCNEIIEDEKNGWIVPAKNVEKLIDKMEWCLTNKELICKMNTICREMIVNRYEQHQFWKQLLKEYQEQINQYKLPKKTPK